MQWGWIFKYIYIYILRERTSLISSKVLQLQGSLDFLVISSAIYLNHIPSYLATPTDIRGFIRSREEKNLMSQTCLHDNNNNKTIISSETARFATKQIAQKINQAVIKQFHQLKWEPIFHKTSSLLSRRGQGVQI